MSFIVRRFAAALILVLVTALSATALELHSIGLRLLLPTFDGPFFIGIEAATAFDFGLATGSFFLTPDGKTLITVSADLEVGEATDTGAGYVRLTTGLTYVDPSRRLPQLVLGGGIAWRYYPLGFLGLGLTAEFLYPMAFPIPMFSVSAGWTP